jgi:type II secretory ATPase GspE/PulE/Tfp pilus assembly ATPase PilB-like protein/GAF domain-containing protein
VPGPSGDNALAFDQTRVQTESVALARLAWLHRVLNIRETVMMNTFPHTPPERSRTVLSTILHRLIQRKCPTAAELNQALSQSLHRVNELLGAQISALFLGGHLPAGIKTHWVALHDNPTDSLELQQHKRALAEEWERQPACMDDGCACGQALRVGERVLISHADGARLCHGALLEKLDIVPDSVALVPLRSPHGAKGCFVCVNKAGFFGGQPRPFSEDDAGVLEDVAYHIGLLLEHCKSPETPLNDLDLARIMARLFRLELMRITPDTAIDTELLREFDLDHLRRYDVLPLKRLGPRAISAALAHPENFQVASEFEIATGQHIDQKFVAPRSDIQAALNRACPRHSRMQEVAEIVSREHDGDTPVLTAEAQPEPGENSAPIINLSRQIVEEAYDQRASDIHIEPLEGKLLIRYRIDGVCREKLTLPASVHRPLVARFKIMADLDIAEHRLPQDGRIVFSRFSPGYDLDLRVSVVPANHGESIVMRILDKKKSLLPLTKLGYSAYNLELYRGLLQAPYGMILHCGPTGSGKSMTLYAALNEINSPELKILTAEDPIEYTLPRIIQVQMKRDIGLTFSSTLRSFLRQDPDIILVGEIRDLETAEIAVEAALTGHLLFSTLHTNDAASTVTRLKDIGIEPFLLSSTLLGICSQRLLRRLC